MQASGMPADRPPAAPPGPAPEDFPDDVPDAFGDAFPDAFADDSAEAMVSAFITLVTDVDRTPAYRARMEGSAGRPLPRSAISILFVLQRHGPLGVKEIADRLGVEQSTASRQIRPLEDNGLVRRTGDPRDGRAVLLDVTDDGRAARERIRQVWLRDIATVWRDWAPEDRAQLGALLTRFRDSYQDLRDRRGDP
ncbi:MarR family winged helix-turn-helix transcriptional regulator [Yinghuangia soli]|uniref:MarR family transcriptional regulator n=1 Tax=Yinghuangia soli TaxID=2908204 RepID=A0AA41Q3I9_9ACTN|nr:MarR family transcriptional regulator [Yinghuangia soli]MCF2530875.1 MarR family transcriptional regulator [Yinghuangia soli]